MVLQAVVWFATVAKYSSFIKAAKQLGQPSSNVSRKVAQLETSLKVKLLNRTTRSVSLTQQGQQLIKMAYQVEQLEEDILQWAQQLQQTASGKLTITAPTSFAHWPLSGWLIEFKQRHKDINIELISANEYLDFHEHKLDYAFRQGPLDNSALIARRLCKIQYGLFASNDFLSNNVINQLQDLNHCQSIAVNAKGKKLPWLFNDGVSINPENVVLALEQTEACLQACIQGIGIAYLSYFDAMTAVNDSQLNPVLENLWAPPVDFYLVYNQREFKPKKNELFVEFLHEKMKGFENAPGIFV